MMLVRTVNGYMYYPAGTGLTTPTSAGTAGLSASSALTSPTGAGATALQTIPNVSPTTVTPSPINGGAHTGTSLSTGFAGYTPSAAPVAAGGLNSISAAGLSTINGALAGYTPAAPTAGSLSGLNGIGGTPGINGLAATGLNGGIAAMSSTTALMGTMGTKWMLPGWSPFGLRFPLVRVLFYKFFLLNRGPFCGPLVPCIFYFGWLCP